MRSMRVQGHWRRILLFVIKNLSPHYGFYVCVGAIVIGIIAIFFTVGLALIPAGVIVPDICK